MTSKQVSHLGSFCVLSFKNIEKVSLFKSHVMSIESMNQQFLHRHNFHEVSSNMLLVKCSRCGLN